VGAEVIATALKFALRSIAAPALDDIGHAIGKRLAARIEKKPTEIRTTAGASPRQP